MTVELAVVPIFVGPLQVLLALLPAILLGLGSALLALFKPSTFKLALALLWRLKLSLLLIIAIVSGSVFAARSVWRRSASVAGSTEAAAQDWPMFRGGIARTGVAAGSAEPLEGGMNWAFASEAKTFHSSPAVVGNRVYITSAEVGVFSTRGAIYCLDADTGAVVWKNAPNGFRATFSSPAVSGKYLLTGEGLHQTEDGRISCLDVTRGGALLWSYRTKSHVESSAAIADGRAYIGAGNDGYYCFALEPDAQGSPVMLWHLDGKKYPDAESAPVVHEGRVYLGLGLKGQAVVCVDAASGRELWRVATPFPVFGPPTIAKGKLLVGMGHGNFVESAEELRAKGAGDLPLHGEVWCIDLATQRVDWRFKADHAVLGAIAAGEERLFFATRGGSAGLVYSLDFHGNELAVWRNAAPILASPAVTLAHVYVAGLDGRLVALDQASLQPAWETRLAAPGMFLSSPSIARGRVYLGSPADGVLCVGRPPGVVDPPVWAGHLGGAGVGGNLDEAPLPERGEILSQWPPARDGGAPPITAPAAANSTKLFVAVVDGSRKGVACLRINPQSTAAPVEEWFHEREQAVAPSLAASETHLAIAHPSARATGSGGIENAVTMRLINAANGERLWTETNAPGGSDSLTLTRAAVLVELGAGTLTSFDFDGGTRWAELLDVGSRLAQEAFSGGIIARLSGPVAVAHGMVFATTKDALVALDELEGKTLWRVPVDERPLTGPVIYRKTILFGTAQGISAHRLIDGLPLRQIEVGPVKSALVLTGDSVCAVNSIGELIVVDPQSGEIHARQPGATPDLPPLRAPGALLYSAAEGLMRFDLANKTAELWMATTELGTLTSPMIMAHGSVWFATEKGGLVRAGNPIP